MIRTKFYIDCQFFQTPAWDRGMGRYTLSLLKALHAMADDIDFTLVFSSHLPKNNRMLQAVKKTLPGATMKDLDLLTTAKLSYAEAAAHNKDVLGIFLRGHPDAERHVFMIPCLFQEPTASVFPDGVEKTLLYYDAIPLLYFHRYLQAIKYDNYLQRHKTLYEADRIFTISQTIADDLALYYGIKTDGTHVINIDGACIDGMLDNTKKPESALPKKYILFSTSDDIRKNNRNAIQAFDQFRSLMNEDYALVVTSHFDPSRQKMLQALSKNVLFTGNVSDAELTWLYEHAEAVLFASEYEGLGLPILEAVRMGKKVVCSNIPVFREISEEAFYFFDPLDNADITHKMYKALRGDGWAEKQKLYKAINKRYTWQRTAALVYDALVAPFALPESTATKPVIAVLAPVPDGYSAIGKVVQELHAETAKHFDVHYYFENRKEKDPIHTRPNYLQELAPCFDVSEFNAKVYRNYDAVLYHIGNSEYHFGTVLSALHLPGIAIFHDTVLREAFGEMVRLGLMHPTRLQAEAQLDSLTGTTKTGFITSVANNQLACIAHSQYAEQAIKNVMRQNVTVHKGELPTELPAQDVQLQHRETVHIGLAGVLTGRKGVDIIKQLALNESLAENITLHVFGFSLVEPEVAEELAQYKNVRLSTDLSDLEYQTQLSGLDILINYRTSYRGETSLTVLEAMRYGCIAIVNGELGWFGELPDDAVVKIGKQDDLVKTISLLVANPQKRQAIGKAAKAYIGAVHSPAAYVALICQVIAAKKTTPNQLRSTAIKQASDIAQVLSDYQKIDAKEQI